METPQTSDKKCSCACHKLVGIFVALIGLTFLLGALKVIPMQAVEVTWPILVLLIGVKLVFTGRCKCCDKA